MIVLGIDTATKVCSVALAKDGKILGELTEVAGTGTSKRLVPAIEALLASSGVRKEELNLVGVSMGPGSFTGLRIGLATAEALSYARKIPLHGVDTLMALAYNYREEGVWLSPLIDAQKGNYYQALYQWQQGNLLCLQSTAIVSAQQVLMNLAGHAAVLLGECFKFQDVPENVRWAEEEWRMPRARGICCLAQRDFDLQKDQKIFGLEPYYIRKSEAEELWEKLHR